MYCSRCGTQNDDTSRFCRSCGLDLAATPLKGEPEVSEIDMVRRELKGEYDILEELGRGGMAIVFKARERQLERDVAIKVLPFSLAFDKEFVERFEREARTSAKLEHPNIIPIYRVGKSGRVTYFVMKYLRGQPLSALLAARGSLPPGEIRQILAQVSRALAYAHKSGIVHRDIKPDNIMFDEHGLALVTDFGIAKAATGGKLTGTGMSIGTPHYMSPEQARAQGLDGRSDLYSLGVVAYQCLTGSVPYDGEDSFSIGYKHIMEDMPTPPLQTQEQRDLFEIIKKDDGEGARRPVPERRGAGEGAGGGGRLRECDPRQHADPSHAVARRTHGECAHDTAAARDGDAPGAGDAPPVPRQGQALGRGNDVSVAGHCGHRRGWRRVLRLQTGVAARLRACRSSRTPRAFPPSLAGQASESTSHVDSVAAILPAADTSPLPAYRLQGHRESSRSRGCRRAPGPRSTGRS